MLQKDNLPQDISNHLSFKQGNVCDYRSGRKYGIAISLFHVMCHQTFNENENGVDVHCQVFIQDRSTGKVEIF